MWIRDYIYDSHRDDKKTGHLSFVFRDDDLEDKFRMESDSDKMAYFKAIQGRLLLKPRRPTVCLFKMFDCGTLLETIYLRGVTLLSKGTNIQSSTAKLHVCKQHLERVMLLYRKMTCNYSVI